MCSPYRDAWTYPRWSGKRSNGSSRAQKNTAPLITHRTRGYLLRNSTTSSAATRSIARSTSSAEQMRSASSRIFQACSAVSIRATSTAEPPRPARSAIVGSPNAASIAEPWRRATRSRTLPRRKPVVERLTDLCVLASQRDRGLKVAELRAAVVAGAAEPVREHAFLLEERADRIGELDLAASAGSDPVELREDPRGEDVAADHREVRRRLLRARLLHDRLDRLQPIVDPRRLHDAVVHGLVVRHLLDAEDRAPLAPEYLHHLLHCWRRGVDEIVGEDHRERFVVDHRSRAQHRVAEPELLGLPDVD